MHQDFDELAFEPILPKEEMRRKVEQLILNTACWDVGIDDTCLTTMRAVPPRRAVRLPIRKLNARVQEEAWRLLIAKYHIGAVIVRDPKTMEVLHIMASDRFTDHAVEKLEMARHMFKSEAWVKKAEPYKGGYHPSLELVLPVDVSRDQIIYARDLLKEWGVENCIAISKDVAGQKMLVIEGFGNINALRKAMPAIFVPKARGKQPVAATTDVDNRMKDYHDWVSEERDDPVRSNVRGRTKSVPHHNIH